MIEDYEARLIGNEFSEIIKLLNQAIERLQRFKESYPYLIAPNVFDVLEANLKENTQVMYRELQNIMRSDGSHYDKKYVCKNCKKVFMISLPDGLCDECRGNMGSE